MYMYICNLATKIDVCHAKSLGSYITLYSTAENFSPISSPPAGMGEIFFILQIFSLSVDDYPEDMASFIVVISKI